MKSIAKLIAIASTIMLVALGGIMLYLNQVKERQSEGEVQEAQKELDMILEDVEQISFTEEDEITPLYLTGKKKNVMTFENASLSEIYTPAYTKKIDKQLRVEKKRGSRRIDNAVWAWNPYGTQPMSLYVYFPTREGCYLNYTISVDSKEIPDFTRTLNNHGSKNLTVEQEYAIIGLLPGRKNYITLRLYGENGMIKKKMIYSIDVPSVPKEIDTQISVTKGYNQTLLGSGLYTIYGNNVKNKKKSYLLFYDNSGYLRSYIPLKSDCAENVEELDGCLFFPYSKNQFVLLSSTGQVKKIYKLEDYELYSGFSYDGSGNIYALADRTGGRSKGSIHDKIIRMNLKTGDISKEIDMGTCLKTVKAKAEKNGKKKERLNWLDLNSIQCIDRSNLVLSARELSSILIIKNADKKNPSIRSILGENILWNGTGQRKKLAKKAGSFTAQFGQHTVTFGNSGAYRDLTPEYDENGNIIEAEDTQEAARQYYLYMFNNNYGNSKTLPNIHYASYAAGTKKKKAAHSYYYQYLYDQTENVYRLEGKMELPFSADYGSVQVFQGNIIAGSSDKKVFMEYTPDGKMLHTYDTNFVFRKVEKNDMKKYWFY